MGTIAKGRLEVLQVYRLLQCVHNGDKHQIEKMVCMGVSNLINLTEPQEGNGALHLASVANDTEMVSFLLSQGAFQDVQDKRGRTPAMRASELGHDNVVALLAERQANMNLVDSEGKGVLFYCVSPTKRHLRCMQVALNSMADVNNVSLKGEPVFLFACEHAHDCEGICMNLLERGADPNATNQATGRTALMEAARAGALDLVRDILQRGGDVNALDKKRFHAAHFAAEGGFFEVIQVLSAYSADLGVISVEGNTPLHYAASGGFTECCRFLAQRGCNPKIKNQKGLLPSQIAKDSGHMTAVKELKKAERLHGKYAEPEVVNPNEPWALSLHDWSCEHEAALRNAFLMADGDLVGSETVSRDAFVAVLQEKGAPVDAECLKRVVLAHDKKREGQVNVSDFFKGLKYLQKTVVISSYGPKKKKASKGAVGKKKGKFVLPIPICTVPQELIHRRRDGGPPYFMIESYQHFTDANRFDRDHPPRHPLEDDSAWYIDKPEKIYININYCVKIGDLESLRLAFSQHVPVDVKDRYYKTPLMTACASGNYEVARFLISLGADVNACDQFSWTPLHHACYAGQMDVVHALVQAGSQVDAPAMNGATPLMRAIQSCRPDCVDYLIKAGAKVQAENKKEQNCLDIARAYADFRIVDLVQAKFDSLSKPMENKKGKGSIPQPTPKPPSSMKDNQETPPTSNIPSDAAMKTKSPKESVIFQNAQITSGAINKIDVSFVPKTVWGKELNTRQLVEKKEGGL